MSIIITALEKFILIEHTGGVAVFQYYVSSGKSYIDRADMRCIFMPGANRAKVDI